MKVFLAKCFLLKARGKSHHLFSFVQNTILIKLTRAVESRSVACNCRKFPLKPETDLCNCSNLARKMATRLFICRLRSFRSLITEWVRSF